MSSLDPPDRRRFISLMSLSLVGACMPSRWPKSARPRYAKPSYCLDPRDHAQRTLEAFIDTIIPGAAADPTGAPGGIEGCVLSTFYDPYFSFSYAVPVVVAGVDSAAKNDSGRLFADLSLQERTRILLELDKQEGGVSVYSLLAAFCRLAFYSGVFSDAGPELAGFPGPSLGYRGQSSHGTEFAKEMTEDGSLP